MALLLTRKYGSQVVVNIFRHHSVKRQLSTTTYKHLCSRTFPNRISSSLQQCASFHRASCLRVPPPTDPASEAPSEPTPTPAPKRPKTEIGFEELLDLLEKEDILLIDVREPKEVDKTGQIPNSINVPLSKLKGVLTNEDDTEFTETYCRAKPTKSDANVIFYGLCDIKGSTAVEIAHKLGYKQARHFPGGYTEWINRHKAEAQD